MTPPPDHDYDEIWRDVYGDLQDHGPVHRHLVRLLRRELLAIEYSSAFEVGCGPGHNLALAAEAHDVDRIGGMDISDVPLAAARARFDGEFVVGDIQVDRPDGTWDLVLASLILEHLVDDEAALANMRAMTGRHLIVVTIGGDFERYRRWEDRMGHLRNYQPDELRQKLEAAGFRVNSFVRWGWPVYSPVVRRLQNRSAVGTGEYTAVTRAIAKVVELAYHLNSSRRGDVYIVRASPRPA